VAVRTGEDLAPSNRPFRNLGFQTTVSAPQDGIRCGDFGHGVASPAKDGLFFCSSRHGKARSGDALLLD
jgi:hypothetical protein